MQCALNDHCKKMDEYHFYSCFSCPTFFLVGWDDYVLVHFNNFPKARNKQLFVVTCSSTFFLFSSSSFCFLSLSFSPFASANDIRKLSKMPKNTSGWTCLLSSQKDLSTESYCNRKGQCHHIISHIYKKKNFPRENTAQSNNYLSITKHFLVYKLINAFNLCIYGALNELIYFLYLCSTWIYIQQYKPALGQTVMDLNMPSFYTIKLQSH